MADEEFVLSMEAVVKLGSMLNLVGISYDRALTIDSSVSSFALDGDLNVDKAVMLSCEPIVKLEVEPTRDCNFGLVSEILGNIQLKPSLTKDMVFELSGNIKPPGISIDPSGDFVWTGESNISPPGLVSSVSLEAVLAGMEAEINSLRLILERMMRSIYDAPPSGSISVLNQITSDNAIAPLSGSTVWAGNTQILQIEIVGTRLDTYTVVFSVRPEPNYAPAIYKDSTGNPGGVRPLGVTTVNTPSGMKQRGMWQIVLDPKDTEQFKKTTTLLYELELQHLGFAENYRIEAGSFLVAV